MSELRRVIQFYGTTDEYGVFSNFTYSPIRVRGKVWTTVEHFFQAMKFEGTPQEEVIRKARTPAKAKQFGRTRRVKLRKDWETIKDAVMREGVLAKFTQHEEMAEILLGTGDALLVEHTTSDDYWGDGGDGHGKNKLGRILMSVREELRKRRKDG
jgi:ribA/ribD-fused uncharacterized protein